jgi:tetratricopeptide (TPR) repeat protein
MKVCLPRVVFFLTFFTLIASGAPGVLAPGDGLEAARREYALHFFSVGAHVNLAKQQYDGGNRLQAFYTLEAARRERFKPKEFTRTFRRIFRNDDFDNSAKTEEALRAQLKTSPEDFDVLQKLADVYISREDWTQAVPLLQSASKVRPQEFAPVAALGQVYERMRKTTESQAVVTAWVKQHPESIEAYRVRIDQQFTQEKFKEARPLVEKALKKFPDDALLHFDMGLVLERADDLVGTRKEFDKAVQLGPKESHVQGWVARFYWKRDIDMRRALDLYLTAYFLDPDFYETEYAEGRIRRIAPEVARSTIKAGKATASPELRPAVENVMLESIYQKWAAGSERSLLEIMGSDDEENRATAMMMLARHPSDAVDEQVSRVLEDSDLRKRGMAGYLAVKWHKEKAFPLMVRWLQDPAELARFDAISALLESGGVPGRKLVADYARSGKEPNAQIREIMAKALNKEEGKVNAGCR